MTRWIRYLQWQSTRAPLLWERSPAKFFSSTVKKWWWRSLTWHTREKSPTFGCRTTRQLYALLMTWKSVSNVLHLSLLTKPLRLKATLKSFCASRLSTVCLAHQISTVLLVRWRGAFCFTHVLSLETKLRHCITYPMKAPSLRLNTSMAFWSGQHPRRLESSTSSEIGRRFA